MSGESPGSQRYFGIKVKQFDEQDGWNDLPV
jgi:hypothetical protein